MFQIYLVLANVKREYFYGNYNVPELELRDESLEVTLELRDESLEVTQELRDESLEVTLELRDEKLTLILPEGDNPNCRYEQ